MEGRRAGGISDRDVERCELLKSWQIPLVQSTDFEHKNDVSGPHSHAPRIQLTLPQNLLVESRPEIEDGGEQPCGALSPQLDPFRRPGCNVAVGVQRDLAEGIDWLTGGDEVAVDDASPVQYHA
jgi:hypothetical protein